LCYRFVHRLNLDSEYFWCYEFKRFKNYFVSKMQECGYTKESETTSGMSFPGLEAMQMYQVDYTKGDDSASVTIVLATINGEQYTFAMVGYDHYVYTEEGSAQQQQEEEQQSSTPNEVTPTGDAATWDEEIKPILENVFGKVYLISYSTVQGQMVFLGYTLSRLATHNDASTLANEFESNRYNVVVVSTEDAQDTVTVMKNNNMVVVTFYNEGDNLEVSITSQ